MSAQNLRKERDVRNRHRAGFKVETIGDDLKQFYVEFHGPEDSLYEGGVWKVKVYLQNEYPTDAPAINFTNLIYHPNIMDPQGVVCLDVLDDDSWKKDYDLKRVFQIFLPTLLRAPNADDPMNQEAADLMTNNLAEYEKKVRAYCKTYASPAEDAPEENAGN